MSKKMMTKITTALVLLAVALPPVFLGGIWLQILLGLITILAGVEVARLSDQKDHWIFTILNIIAMGALAWLPKAYFIAVCAIWLMVLFLVALFDEKETVDHIAFTFVITMLVGIALRCVSDMYANEMLGLTSLLYIVIGCYMTDTMAYFFGVFLGKHKLIERVSPNKTWEGAIGGYLSGAVLSFVFGLFFCGSLPIPFMVCASLLIPLNAQIGDLSFSLIKRRFGLKDFGNAFPEHGGILDRVDSLIFCLMIFNALLILWEIV